MVAALLLLKALPASGAGNGAVLLQPGLEGLVVRLILHQQDIDVYKRREKTTPFGVNFMRSQVLYEGAQDIDVYLLCLLLRCLKRDLTFPRMFEDQPDMQISRFNCALYTP